MGVSAYIKQHSTTPITSTLSNLCSEDILKTHTTTVFLIILHAARAYRRASISPREHIALRAIASKEKRESDD
jgi:hypothetical protein